MTTDCWVLFKHFATCFLMVHSLWLTSCVMSFQTIPVMMLYFQFSKIGHLFFICLNYSIHKFFDLSFKCFAHYFLKMSKPLSKNKRSFLKNHWAFASIIRISGEQEGPMILNFLGPYLKNQQVT